MHRPTIEVYDRAAARWDAARPADRLDAAAALGRRAGQLETGGPLGVARPGEPAAVLDAGCGQGNHLAALGPAAVGVDASGALLRLARAAHPAVPLLRADLTELPLRRGAVSGAWACRSLVHLPRAGVPRALAELHRVLALGAPIELVLFEGDHEFGPLPGDDFPGRLFSRWPLELLAAVVEGGGFTVEAIDRVPRRHSSAAPTAAGRRASGVTDLVVRAVRAHTLADVVGPGMRLLVCGLNPSRYAADAGVGYARPGNRFWAAAQEAGLVSRPRDPWHALRHHGVGMTDLVKRATVRADELGAAEFGAGVDRVERLVRWLRPAAVCLVGLSGWRVAVDRRAEPGRQPRDLGGRPVYLVPSTSGLNSRTSLAALAEHLRAAAGLAGEA